MWQLKEIKIGSNVFYMKSENKVFTLHFTTLSNSRTGPPGSSPCSQDTLVNTRIPSSVSVACSAHDGAQASFTRESNLNSPRFTVTYAHARKHAGWLSIYNHENKGPFRRTVEPCHCRREVEKKKQRLDLLYVFRVRTEMKGTTTRSRKKLRSVSGKPSIHWILFHFLLGLPSETIFRSRLRWPLNILS